MTRLLIAQLSLACLIVQYAAAAIGHVPPRTTPVMGWNAWNTFSVNGKPVRGGRAEYESIVDTMVVNGMVEKGYTVMSTVCTDWIGRDSITHELQQNLTLWPGGMESFADYVHSKGMQLSVYTDAGVKNCCGEPGSLGYEDIDMKTFASWGVDAVAIDYCGGPKDVQGAYTKFADAIVESGRDMALGMFNLGLGMAYQWAPQMSQNMTAATAGNSLNGSWVPHVRLMGDIGNEWSGSGRPTASVMTTLDTIQGIPDLWHYGLGNASGTFPNYGQLVVGVQKDHPTIGDPGLSLVEAQSHFSLWSMLGSSILATNDVRLRDKNIEKILLNDEVIAVNQDAWTQPAFRLTNNCSGQQWARYMANGDIAVLILNRGSESVRSTVELSLVAPHMSSTLFSVRDIQGRMDLTDVCGRIGFDIQPHGTIFVRFTPRHDKTCTPEPIAPCTTPAPPTPGGGGCPNGPCRPCSNPAKACPFPVPPLPPCPPGFVLYDSGYWSNPDQRTSRGHSLNITACAAYCTGLSRCTAFEVYDPFQVTEPISRGGSACYTFSNGKQKPFTTDNRGLIRTCVKA